MRLIVVAFNLLLLSSCMYAFWRGGAPERLTALAFLLAAAGTLLLHLPRTTEFDDLEVGVLLVDAALLAFLVGLSVRANRYWPLWVTAIHISTLAVHLAKALNPALVWPVYATAASVASIPMILILWIGTMRHQQRLKRLGSDAPWRGSSP